MLITGSATQQGKYVNRLKGSLSSMSVMDDTAMDETSDDKVSKITYTSFLENVLYFKFWCLP